MSHVDDGALHALVDDELDAVERAAVEAHLAACGDCARRFAEATAMARQVVSLLGALDDVSAPVRIAPAMSRGAAVAPPRLTPIARRVVTLRRVAIAASVLLVAGVSYEVGQRRDAASVATAEAARTPAAFESPTSAPSVTTVTVDSIAAPAAPTLRVAPSGGASLMRHDAIVAARPTAPSAAPVSLAPPITPTPPAPSVAELSRQKAVADLQSVVVADSAADRAAQGAAGQVASRRATAADAQEQQQQQRAVASQAFSRGEQRSRNAAPATDLGAAAPEAIGRVTATAPGALAGYRATDELLKSAVVRRRYVATDGTILVLLIAPSISEVPKPNAKASPEFTVSTLNGRSTVRWQVAGLTYELQGALPPDSLVKLATQLK